MTVSESARYEMHKELRTRLGEPVADTLMEHLPPSGWSDVARTSDLQLVKGDLEHLRGDLNHLRGDLELLRDDMNTRFSLVEKRIDSIVHGLWTAVGIFSGAFIALFSLIAAKG